MNKLLKSFAKKREFLACLERVRSYAWSFSHLDPDSRSVKAKAVKNRELGKLKHQGAICWFQKELFWRLGTLHFFRNKTFLFVKIDT